MFSVISQLHIGRPIHGCASFTCLLFLLLVRILRTDFRSSMREGSVSSLGTASLVGYFWALLRPSRSGRHLLFVFPGLPSFSSPW